jgi:hypothetical protein
MKRLHGTNRLAPSWAAVLAGARISCMTETWRNSTSPTTRRAMRASTVTATRQRVDQHQPRHPCSARMAPVATGTVRPPTSSTIHLIPRRSSHRTRAHPRPHQRTLDGTRRVDGHRGRRVVLHETIRPGRQVLSLLTGPREGGWVRVTIIDSGRSGSRVADSAGSVPQTGRSRRARGACA